MTILVTGGAGYIGSHFVRYLERRKIEISSSEFEREAITTKNLNEEERLKVEKLLNMIDEDEDVQNVYHDMKIID